MSVFCKVLIGCLMFEDDDGLDEFYECGCIGDYDEYGDDEFYDEDGDSFELDDFLIDKGFVFG